MTELRTPAEALTLILSTRLRFGDPDQLEALNILRAAEDLIGQECPECEGAGESDGQGHCDNCGELCEHCSHRCRYCRGEGIMTRDRVYRTPVKSLIQKRAA